MRTRPGMWVVSAAIVFLAFACGAPRTPDGASVDAAAPPAASASAAPVATADKADAAPPAVPTLDGPRTTGTITMDDDDGCTKIAAAFEQKARPKIKECYREGKKSNPVLEGAVRITMAVDGFGKLGDPKPQDATLPDAVVKCMVKAVHDTPFDDASKCKRKGITLPIQFPTK